MRPASAWSAMMAVATDKCDAPNSPLLLELACLALVSMDALQNDLGASRHVYPNLAR